MRLPRWAGGLLLVAAPLSAQTGVEVRSADGSVQARLRAFVQADGRSFLGEPDAGSGDGFVVRRLRPTLEVTVRQRFRLRMVTDFGGGRVVLIDGFGEVTPVAGLRLRLGKFKPPLHLEGIHPAADLRFVERGLTVNLFPFRDVGAMVAVTTAGGRVDLEGAVLNGSADLSAATVDRSSGKDVVGRILVRPGGDGIDAAIGIAGSLGRDRGPGAEFLSPGYRSPGQRVVFRYRAGVEADGRRIRLTPQGYLYAGPVGVLVEAVANWQDVSAGAERARLEHRAWQIGGSVVITGARARLGGVEPRRSWGALEIGVRAAGISFDRRSFGPYADPTESIRRATAAVIGVTWHFTPATRLVTNFERTGYRPSDPVAPRAPEHLLATRLQVGF